MSSFTLAASTLLVVSSALLLGACAESTDEQTTFEELARPDDRMEDNSQHDAGPPRHPEVSELARSRQAHGHGALDAELLARRRRRERAVIRIVPRT